MIEWDDNDQKSEGWHAARRGVITASRFEDATSCGNGFTRQQQTYVDAVLAGKGEATALDLAGYKKKPSSDLIARALAGEVLPLIWSDTALSYAHDKARERLGGFPLDGGQSFAMRVGIEQEASAVDAYELERGVLTRSAGFAYTSDRRFGVSVDRLVGHDGMLEVKTMVSSSSLFSKVVDRDIAEYLHQCQGGMWLLTRRWCDLCLWVYDLQILIVIRIDRDDGFIDAMSEKLVLFDRLVDQKRISLARALGIKTAAEQPGLAAVPAARATAAARLPAAVAAQVEHDLIGLAHLAEPSF